MCGIIASPERDLGQVEKLLEEAFGAIDLRSERVPFDKSSYYQQEMGGELVREWVSLKQLIQQDEIADAKLATNRIEERLARPDGSRTVNLDPGYILPSRLVLATTKDFAHRVYLAKGIYAEVTLIYREGKFQPLEWTYPDYRQAAALDFFMTVRNAYLAQLGGDP